MADHIQHKNKMLVEFLSRALQDTQCDEETNLSIYLQLQQAASLIMNQQMRKEKKSETFTQEMRSSISNTFVVRPQVYHRITYSSKMVIPKGSSVVKEVIPIINFATVENQKMEIGGMLFCDVVDGRIIQVLEGDKTKVMTLYSRISEDKRHEKVVLLKEESVRERKYKAWGMQFAQTEQDWHTVKQVIREERRKGLARDRGVKNFSSIPDDLDDDLDDEVCQSQIGKPLSGLQNEEEKMKFGSANATSATK